MNQSIVSFLLSAVMGFLGIRVIRILPTGLDKAEAIILAIVIAYLAATETYQLIKRRWRR